MAIAWSLLRSLCSPPPLCSARCCTTITTSPHKPQEARFPLQPISLSASHHPFPSTANPSLQFANVMWFNKPYNAQILVGENEPAEAMVRRFRKAVMQAGVIAECRRRLYFETRQEAKKRKKQAAQRKRSRRPRNFSFDRKGTFSTPAPPVSQSNNDDDDDDYWGYIEEDA